MNNITLKVNKANVYDEVAKTTSYTGAKMKDDADAYERIFTTDEDRMMLERFWVEACNGATEEFKQFIVSVSDQPESHGVELEKDYEVELELSTMFDTRLKGSMETSLFSYFVNAIVAKWFKFTNRSEAETYGADATTAMMDVKSKMFFRKKPTRKAVE